MAGLALRSVRMRRASCAATFVSVLLATALIGSFAALAQTAGGTHGSDREMLVIMGVVVGSWGAVIALFSLASTVGVTVRNRDAEIGLLRTIGATPAQARRLVRAETATVAVVAAAIGTALAWLGGRALLAMLQGTDLIDDAVRYGGGTLSLGLTGAGIVAISVLAATVAGRRATRDPARLAVVAARRGPGPLRRWRIVVGLLLIAYGATAGVLTGTVMRHSDDPYAPMQTAGTAAILVAVGFACVAPVVLRAGMWLLRPLLAVGGRIGDPAVVHLATVGARRRSAMLGPIMGPVAVFCATTVTVLMMAGIDDRTLSALVVDQQEADTITLLNLVVCGMIAVFAAIVVVNSLVAVVSQRGAELRGLHLVGASVTQLRRAVLVELLAAAVVGTGLGLAASLVSVVPYAIARDEGVVADGWWWVVPATALTALAIVAAAGVATVRRVTRPLILDEAAAGGADADAGTRPAADAGRATVVA